MGADHDHDYDPDDDENDDEDGLADDRRRRRPMRDDCQATGNPPAASPRVSGGQRQRQRPQQQGAQQRQQRPQHQQPQRQQHQQRQQQQGQQQRPQQQSQRPPPRNTLTQTTPSNAELARRIDANRQAIATLLEAQSNATAKYHLAAARLLAVYAPFKLAVRDFETTATNWHRQNEAWRAALLELFFVAVSGGIAGVIASRIKTAIEARTGLRHRIEIAAGASTATADIEKYLGRLVPMSLLRADAPTAPVPQSAAPQGIPPQAPQPQGPRAPQGTPPQPAGPHGNDSAPRREGAAQDTVDPEVWIANQNEGLHTAAGVVAQGLGRVARKLGEDFVTPADESATQFVDRIMAPIAEITAMPKPSKLQFGEVLWTQWMQTTWLQELQLAPGAAPGDAHRRLREQVLRDRALFAAIREQAGTDRPYRTAVEARFREAQDRSWERHQQQREIEARAAGRPVPERQQRGEPGMPDFFRD